MAVSSRSSPDRNLGNFRDTISTSGVLPSKHGHTGQGPHNLPMHSVNEPRGSESEETSSDNDSEDNVSLLTGEVETLSLGDEDLEDEDMSTIIMIDQAAGGVCTGPNSTSRKRTRSGNGKGSKNLVGGKDNGRGSKKRNTQDGIGGDEGGQGSDDDGSDTPPRGSDVTAPHADRIHCPFRLRNPLRFNTREHPPCTSSYKDVSHVKAHIRERHSLEGATRNSEDGITLDTGERLRGRTNQAKISTWEMLWKLLFPQDEEVPNPIYQVVPFADLHEFDVLFMRKILDFQRETFIEIENNGGILSAESQASLSEKLERNCKGAFQEFREYIVKNSPPRQNNPSVGRRKKNKNSSQQSTSPTVHNLLPANARHQNYSPSTIATTAMADPGQASHNMHPPVTTAFHISLAQAHQEYYDAQFVTAPNAPMQGNAAPVPTSYDFDNSLGHHPHHNYHPNS